MNALSAEASAVSNGIITASALNATCLLLKHTGQPPQTCSFVISLIHFVEEAILIKLQRKFAINAIT